MDTFMNPGEVAQVAIIERWGWWQGALADPSKIGTKELPIHPGEYQLGYYRTRRKNGPGSLSGFIRTRMASLLGSAAVGRSRIWSICFFGPAATQSPMTLTSRRLRAVVSMMSPQRSVTTPAKPTPLKH